jgi:hypothetical protein
MNIYIRMLKKIQIEKQAGLLLSYGPGKPIVGGRDDLPGPKSPVAPHNTGAFK